MSGLRCSISFCETGDVYCEPAWWIGLRSGGSHGESPNGMLQCVGLDVEAEEVTEEVQTERVSVVDWTLKWWKGKQKSKMDE